MGGLLWVWLEVWLWAGLHPGSDAHTRHSSPWYHGGRTNHAPRHSPGVHLGHGWAGHADGDSYGGSGREGTGHVGWDAGGGGAWGGDWGRVTWLGLCGFVDSN